jgi:poly(3-hydroxyalkanoate) synthetase
VESGVESKIKAPNQPEGNNIGLSLVLEKNLYEIKNGKGYVLLNQINPDTFVIKSFVKRKIEYRVFKNYFVALKSYKRRANKLMKLAFMEVIRK